MRWTTIRRMVVGLLRGESGQSSISTALTMSVMLVFTLGLMQVCMAYYQHERISEMAREGARYAALHGSTCKTSSGSSCTVTAAQVQTYINSIGYPDLGGGTLATPTVTWTNSGSNAPGSPVQITLSYSFPYKLPFITTITTLTMTSTSQMTILV